jgi:CubicO group peptidase (beta-lactamase class C family)
MIRQALILTAAALTTSPGQAQALDDASRAKIDGRVSSILERTQTPSASIAVIIGGRIAYVHAYGLARVSPPVKAAPSTRYQIASLSKEIVAAAALLLQQEGKLSLDDKVARWLPQLTAAHEVTLRQCLTHTAGYPDFWPQDYVPEWMLRPTSTERILADWGRKPLSFTPGSSWQYSNTGYVVAARIIEMAAHEPLFDLINERIFRTLGITDAVDTNRTALQAPDALGYIRAALAPVEPQAPAATGWMFGAWPFALTAEDLARWDLSILHRTLLSPESYHAELTPARLTDGTDTGYALGLRVGKRYGRRLLSHGGEGAGYLSMNRIYPDDDAAVVVLTNTFSGAPQTDIADAIEFVILQPTGIDARVLAIFDGLQHGRVDRSALTADFNAYLDARTAADYARTLGPLGPPTAFLQTGSEDRGGMKSYDYRIVAGEQPLSLSVYVTADGRIEQFLIAPASQ